MANTPYYTKAEAQAQNQQTYREIKETTEAISAGEGGKLYDTLAEAQAVSPKPVDGTVFRVSEMDVANAGLYSFQSSQTNGTRLEKKKLNPREIPLIQKNWGINLTKLEKAVDAVDVTAYGISIVFKLSDVSTVKWLLRFEVNSGIQAYNHYLMLKNSSGSNAGAWANALEANKLYHLMLSYDGYAILNGKKLSTSIISVPFKNGRVELDANVTYYSVKVFNRAFTAEEENSLYNNGKPLNIPTLESLSTNKLLHLDARDMHSTVWRGEEDYYFRYSSGSLTTVDPQPKEIVEGKKGDGVFGQTVINENEVSIQGKKLNRLVSTDDYYADYIRDNYSYDRYRNLSIDYLSGNLKSTLEEVSVAINNSDGKHRAFGGSVYDGTTLYVSYRKGDTHYSVGEYGEAVMIKSTDNGLTFGAEQVIVSVSQRDVRDPVLFITSTGRLILRYFVRDATELSSYAEIEQYTKYSDDGGVTWSTPFKFLIPSEISTAYPNGRLSGWGNIIEKEGVLYTSVYLAQVTILQSLLYKSEDNGLSWNYVSTINDTDGVDETSLGFTQDGKMFAVMRASNVSFDVHSAQRSSFIAYSDDLGATWYKRGRLPVVTQCPYLIDLGEGLQLLGYRSRTEGLYTIYAEQECHMVLLKNGHAVGNVIAIDKNEINQDVAYPSFTLIGELIYIAYYRKDRGIIIKKIPLADIKKSYLASKVGASGSYTSSDGKTITVTNGLITEIL